ncbi:fungal-specific transcription factor domain-containing protein [Talaromyces proteolyticus]|uniref:Fungal-specific transcription factor domain-containing protein n=1 Tax=Talaromyces proteolyticus TaxID=1131652 RepID=A0AAD4Q3N1_9EURO|nr:fungal-specific transcription factor domain-containing protein [Talaromyces proteolyticus]KAH8701902.1 fungal-specific transcription factor domain-containing protein [Talaromyces proteolyticus]
MERESSKEITPRKRVAVACSRCRLRKYKCDGAKPSCSTCSSAKHLSIVCTYETSNKKRGLPEGYVRGMEKLWGIAMRKIDRLEELLLSVLNNDQDPLLQAWNDNSSGPLRVWRKSRLARALDRHLPILELNRDSAGKRKRYIAFSDADEEGDDERDERQKEGYGDSSFQVEDMIDLPDALTTEGNNINSQLDELGPQPTIEPPRQLLPAPISDRLPPCIDHLVNVYFSYTHCWFPILEKHEIRRLVYWYSRNGHSNGEKAPYEALEVILWAISALVTHQVSQSELWSKNCGLHNPTADLVGLYYQKTRNLIPAEEDEASFHLEHVQALLILVLLNIGHGEWSAAWLLVGKAIQMAITLGLGRGPQCPPSKERHSRSLHVFWGCFVLDTMISARIKRMPRLRPEDINGMAFLCEEGDEEWDSLSDCLQAYKEKENTTHPLFILSTFNRLIEICRILNNHCVSQHHSRTECSSFSSSGRQLIKNLMDWNSSQRSTPKFDAQSRDSTAYLHHYNIQLIYLLSLMIINQSMQRDHAEKHLDTSNNVHGGHPMGRLGLLVVSLLQQQSERHSLLVVPPTYAFISEDFIGHSEAAVDHTTSYTAVFPDLLKVWPGFRGQARRHHSLGNTSDSMLQPSTNTLQQNLQGEYYIPMGITNGEVSKSGPFRLMQHEPQLGRYEGLSVGDNSSLSEVDLHSAFDELVTMDTTYWTSSWRQGLANLGFTDDDQINDFCNFS